jgi:hypothetical protein
LTLKVLLIKTTVFTFKRKTKEETFTKEAAAFPGVA